MDAEYCKDKILALSEANTALRVRVRSLRKVIHIYQFLALVGWLAFIAALYYGN
jgi:hypothetical protein